MLAGGNVAAVEGPDGVWEVLQFQTATLIAPSTYELSTLLRGQAGTEGAMGMPIPAGARFLAINSAVVQVDMTEDQVGLAFNWKYGPFSRDIGHQSYQDRIKAFSGLGLRPLSPVHVRSTRVGNDVGHQLDPPHAQGRR